MINEVAATVIKEVAKEASEATIDTAVLEAKELPETIGELSEVEALPDEIDMMPEDEIMDSIPDTGGAINYDSASSRAETHATADTSDGANPEDKKAADDSQETEKKGGSYKDVKTDGEGDRYEVHHMPADSASNLDRGDGPAIKMEKEDHRQTASCGMSREAQEYRARQKELIEQGKFREALQMDIDDIHEKFGDKYDDAIAEMLEYVDQLEKEGKI